MPDDPNPGPIAGGDAFATLLRAAREQGGLPSVGHTLSRLVTLLESDSEAVQQLTDLVLADVALTQRLLQFANTVPYRGGTPGVVTTVSRAILLLGFDRVRAAVTSLVLLDGLVGTARSQNMRGEFRAALVAGGLARECLSAYDDQEGEEASIAAMFRSVGRLLMAVFAPSGWAATLACMRREGIAESVAVRRTFGRPLEELTDAVLREWNVPDRILAAAQPLPPRLAPPAGSADRIRIAAQFADEVAAALRRAGPQPQRRDVAVVLDRFAPALAFEPVRLGLMIEAALQRADEFEAACKLPPSPLLRREAISAALTELAARAPAASSDAAGRPANWRALLLAGLDDATRVLIAGGEGAQTLNEVVARVLDAIRNALGYRRCALALGDAGSGAYRVRVCSGEPALPATPLVLQIGQPLLARMADGDEWHVDDLGAVRHRGTVPEALERDLADARSLLFLPVILPGRPLGFIVAERPVTDPDGPGAEELALLRALRNQVLIAIRMRGREG